MGRAWLSLKRRNPKLLLAAIDQLVDSKTQRRLHLGFDGGDAFFTKTLKRAPGDPDVADEQVQTFLLSLDLPDGRFAQVRDLLLDGDKWAYAMIGGFGESGDDFAVDSLVGLELFPKLETLRSAGMLRRASLTPLAKATQLKTLQLDASDLIDEGALLKVKTLRTLQVLNLQPRSARFDELLQVLLTLANRGVAITGVDSVAHWLVAQRRCADALKLYDSLVHGGPWVSPSTYSAALYAVLTGNSGLPLDRARAKRYLTAALPIGPREPGIFYNAACVWVELGEVDQVLECLRLACAHGYPKLKAMQADTAFDSLRDDPRFVAIFRR